MQPILQHIFKKNSLQEVPVEDLQQLVDQYPYFAPARFLLTEKLLKTMDASFEEQLQKTAVYFYNPLWLQYQLKENSQVEEVHLSGAEPGLTGNQLHAEVLPALHEQTDESGPSGNGNMEMLNGESTRNMPHPAGDVESLIFSAYHTIDYFASQGIKLNADNLPDDKLGKQMKSFTEWLKTMRRLPQASGSQTLEKINEEAIYQHASHSLEEKEIITEAMAEVLIKQQSIEKAIQIYNKLGLLYPSKNTYFASKIEALKQ